MWNISTTENNCFLHKVISYAYFVKWEHRLYINVYLLLSPHPWCLFVHWKYCLLQNIFCSFSLFVSGVYLPNAVQIDKDGGITQQLASKYRALGFTNEIKGKRLDC